jgi:hypothetical protein
MVIHMAIKSALFVVALLVAAAFAPMAWADSGGFELVINGTDYSVLAFSDTSSKLTVTLPLQLGSTTLLEDVVLGTKLGTIDLEEFDSTDTLVQTLAFTKSTATSFLLGMSGGQSVNFVSFSFDQVKIIQPAGSTGAVPEPSSLGLLAAGIFCVAGIRLGRSQAQTS